jgi:hypothetical protein
LNAGVQTAPKQATSSHIPKEKLKVFRDFGRVQIPSGTPTHFFVAAAEG